VCDGELYRELGGEVIKLFDVINTYTGAASGQSNPIWLLLLGSCWVVGLVI
jgi:hypothetical protein